MLKFLAKTENIRSIRPKDSNYNRGKVVKKSSAKWLNSNESRAVLILAGDRK